MSVTPIRTFRIADDVYDAAARRAADNSETLTDVVIRALAVYAGPPEKQARNIITEEV